MVFSSFPFLWLFLPLFFLGLLIFRRKGTNLFLLAASVLFYAWGEPKYVVLLLFSVTLNWLGGLFFLKERSLPQKRFAAAILILIDLTLLGYFKYYNFFAQTINGILHGEYVPLRAIALPIGISFFTFQEISYIIDLTRGEIQVQRSWFKLALYIAFFPQLVAGPIIKYKDIAPQLDSRELTRERLTNGLERFCYGLAKKVLIANTLGYTVDEILSHDFGTLSSLLCWTAAIFYTLQIYFDFSGYSDMAIGLAAALGFDFRENFNFPYISASVQEFWRRWHISLSGWFRDYLYIPLGGNRKGNFRTILNLAIVFFATGLWHGAQWNFVIWGLYHGFFLILERLGLKAFMEKRFPLWLRRILVFGIAVIGWVFFRADDSGMAFAQLRRMFLFTADSAYSFAEIVSPFSGMIFCLALILATGVQKRFQIKSELLRGAWALICLFAAFVLLANASHNPFIYFRF